MSISELFATGKLRITSHHDIRYDSHGMQRSAGLAGELAIARSRWNESAEVFLRPGNPIF